MQVNFLPRAQRHIRRAMTFKASITVAIATCALLLGHTAIAQGTWTAVDVTAPDNSGGVMILLPDGSVMCKARAGFDDIGNYWNRLSPDINGSYVHGTWNTTAPMVYSRLYFSSQVLQDGRVYVAGGEYGNGKHKCEIYDPVMDSWSPGPAALHASDSFFDADSELLPDGKVLQAVVTGGSKKNYIYDPIANTYVMGPTCLKSHNEASWVKLPDSSILFIDIKDTTSERYIPSLNRWVKDGTMAELIYDIFGSELGGGFLLPDGRVFFIGAVNKTAYYTPSGDTTPGVWSMGPTIPLELGAPDAAATMMSNGKILCAFSPVPTDLVHFNPPTYFYEFDYTANTFTQIHSPMGGDTTAGPCYYTNMLNLPDGSILFSAQGSSQYYVYKPTGAPLAAGKPTIDSVFKIDCITYMVTGKLFNGISEGTCYGDDWQNATNYPLVRLIDEDSSVRYARTYNWNRTGVMTGSLPDTVTFTIDAAMPEGAYTLQLVVNGNPSADRIFKTCNAPNGIEEITAGAARGIYAYPNPATKEINLAFQIPGGGKYDIRLIDVLGRVARTETGISNTNGNIHTMRLDGVAKGIYTVAIRTENEVLTTKIIVE